MKRSLAVFFVLLLSVSAFAQDISVEAEIGKKQIAVGDSVRFIVRIEGSQSADAPEIPSVDGLDIRYVGPSTQVSIVNGRYSSSVAHTYSIFPMKTGTYRIPPLAVNADGRTFQTGAIDLEVVASQAAGTSSGTSQPVTDLKDKMFLVTKVPKTDVYVREPVPVKILLFIASDVAVGDVQIPRLSADGFEKDDFKYKQYQKAVDGVRFSVIEFETIVYPQREGGLVLGPAQVPFNLIVDAADDGGFGDRSLFEDSFFGSFFSRQESRPVALESDEIQLNVKPLPAQGAPSDFNGAVGQFNFDMTVGPNEAEVGDPLTVRMQLTGTGSLADAELPAIRDSEHFKVYEPSRKTDKTVKSLEQVVIPLSEKIVELPAVSFSYFDPSDGQYRTIRKGPFPLKIKPASQKTQTYSSSPGSQMIVPQVQSEVLGEDIVFIKNDPGRLKSADARFYKSAASRIWPAVYAVMCVVLMAGLMFRRRLKTDQAFADELKAAQSARRTLVKLREIKNPAEFYNGVHGLLIEYFSRKLRIPPGEVDAASVTGHPRWKAPEDVTRQVTGIFNECESVRFASADVSESQMRETLQNIETIIRKSEKVIR